MPWHFRHRKFSPLEVRTVPLCCGTRNRTNRSNCRKNMTIQPVPSPSRQDGSLLATTDGVFFRGHCPQPDEGDLCIWDVKQRKLLVKFSAHYGCVTSANFSPDGKTLATTGRDGKMHLWDVEDLLEFGVHQP